MMDPRDETGPALPQNLEAEQAVLGILLFDGDALRDVHDRVTAEDFFEPFHQRLFAVCVDGIRRSGQVDTALLSGWLATDPAWQAFGGSRGLMEMAEKAGSPKLAGDYAQQIADAALRRRLIRMGQEAIVRARDEDLTGFEAIAATRVALESAERGAAPEDALFVNAHDAALTRMDRLELERATGKPKGTQTGLSCFDKRLGGLMPGSVIVLAGRPGMGKTALLGNVLYSAAAMNPTKLFAGFSLEMDTDQLNDRALSRLTVTDDQTVSFSDIAKVLPLTAFDMEALHRAKDRMPRNLWLRDRAGVSVDDVSRAVWAMKRKGDLAAIGIDYLQLMKRPALQGRNEASAIAEMTGALKNLAREARITIILLSQLNRSVESRDDKRPMLSDLRESGSIEQDADAVLFPYREIYYLQKSEPKAGTHEHLKWEEDCESVRRLMDVIIAKNRHGSEGVEPMDYRAEIDLIQNRRA